MGAHQYVDRRSGAVVDERLFGEAIVSFLYSRVREDAPSLFRALTGARSSQLWATLCFDLPLADRLLGSRRFLARAGLDLDECLDPPEHFTTARSLFERKLRYWSCRRMPAERDTVVSPAEARLTLASLARTSELWLKGKLFSFEELLGEQKTEWLRLFEGGDVAVLRLTPEKYHYTHMPVAGIVEDLYELGGTYHSCCPQATVELVTPLSKNKRTVTVIDTDVEDGSGVGRVAIIEVVALMVGEVVQCFSRDRYDDPHPLVPGLFVERGQVKALFRPGSSTVVLLFEPGRVDFAHDLVSNLGRGDVASVLSRGFGQPLVETEVRVRSLLAHPRQAWAGFAESR